MWMYICGGVLRLFMLLLGEYLDRYGSVTYTDIDYYVFTDAARFVVNGKSPYDRATYRYTPLLSMILAPNITFHLSFGKYIFSLCDLGVGYLMQKLLETSTQIPQNQIPRYLAFWLLNPIVANIPTRGSAESIVNLSIFVTLYFVLVRKNILYAAFAFGLAVHLKIYPIIYAIPILFAFSPYSFPPQTPNSSRSPKKVHPKYTTFVKSPRDFISLCFSRECILFTIYSASTFFALNIAMYLLYGTPFLHHTYFYHFIRKDHRHNFSLWFLTIYSNFNLKSSSLFAILSFLPQFLVVFFIPFVFQSDLLFSVFCQTFAFVAFNKVCTAQAVYLYYGNQLENLGQNVFQKVWYSGIFVFAVNVYILGEIIKNHRKQDPRYIKPH
ncbi:hypothetical protein BB560_005446 [Smittium megazygosporum]|uniref:GPI mannosyltransferase 1 n=1 Tax=Smittium megazygosporum TaxID=133381 RepID=A0A2T9Z5E5_9FUNG|nr:hypothetical protein BB560_005446 [Smittium megazygosporum]